MALKRAFVLTSILLLFLLYWTKITEADTKKTGIIWKMATNSPEGMTLTRFFNEDMPNALERATNGEVTFSWYHGGIMGDDEDWIAKMHIDQLQGAALDSSGVDVAIPEMGIVQLPFLLKDSKELTYLREKLRQRLIKLFEKSEYKVLMFIAQPFDDFYSIPISVPEVVPSTRAGICNAMLAPAAWYVGSQLYTLTKYVTPSSMRITLAAVVVTMKAWNRTPEKYHKAILEAMSELEPQLDSVLITLNGNCYKAMIKYGVKEVKLTPGEIEVLKKKTRPVWDNLAGKVYPRDLLDDTLRYLEESRKIKMQ
jgi:TRAP-type C4-dicarboxylate transport system substrate-binding protein